MQKPVRHPIDDAIISDLARQFADYRLKGCPSGGAAAVQESVRKVAKRHGWNFSELWAEVHRIGYAIIDAA